MIPETGLEAGDAIGYERSCFKASSGDHPKFKIALYQRALYHPPTHMQVIFLFISKIFLKSHFRARNHEENLLYCKQCGPVGGMRLTHTLPDGFSDGE